MGKLQAGVSKKSAMVLLTFSYLRRIACSKTISVKFYAVSFFVCFIQGVPKNGLGAR
jgi:hypothetical protein